MIAYRDEALAILKEFEDSDAKRALEQMVEYTTDRKY
jgi:octaprenyl-diphosphate synthase